MWRGLAGIQLRGVAPRLGETTSHGSIPPFDINNIPEPGVVKFDI